MLRISSLNSSVRSVSILMNGHTTIEIAASLHHARLKQPYHEGLIPNKGTDRSSKMVITSDNPGLSKDDTRVCWPSTGSSLRLSVYMLQKDEAAIEIVYTILQVGEEDRKFVTVNPARRVYK
jgi:hypothetical protein